MSFAAKSQKASMPRARKRNISRLNNFKAKKIRGDNNNVINLIIIHCENIVSCSDTATATSNNSNSVHRQVLLNRIQII